MPKIISGLFLLALVATVATANADSLPFSTVFKGRDKFDAIVAFAKAFFEHWTVDTPADGVYRLRLP